MKYLFLSLLWAPIALADSLTILAYTAPTPLDWSTPGSLTRTTIDNSLFGLIGRWRDLGRGDREYEYVAYPHAISHLNVELICNGETKILTGMTSLRPDGEYLKGLALKGKSLETMVEDVPGGLISTKKVKEWLPIMTERGYVRRVKWQLHPKACARLEEYFADYQKLGLEKLYGGLNSRPLEAKGGAGCAAFAVSFLQVAGLYDASLYDDVWKRNLRLHEKYITRVDKLAERGIWSFLLYGYDGAWAKENEPHLKVSLWDPQRMYDWIGDVHQGRIEFDSTYTPFKTGKKSLGLEIDARDVAPPQGPIWDAQTRHLIETGAHLGVELKQD
jgi:hypothetical protein